MVESGPNRVNEKHREKICFVASTVGSDFYYFRTININVVVTSTSLPAPSRAVCIHFVVPPNKLFSGEYRVVRGAKATATNERVDGIHPFRDPNRTWAKGRRSTNEHLLVNQNNG